MNTHAMDMKEALWYSFVILTLISGVFWHVCKEESNATSRMYSPLWFLEDEIFTDKGNKYRKGFILVTGLAFLSLLSWALV